MMIRTILHNFCYQQRFVIAGIVMSWILSGIIYLQPIILDYSDTIQQQQDLNTKITSATQAMRNIAGQPQILAAHHPTYPSNKYHVLTQLQNLAMLNKLQILSLLLQQPQLALSHEFTNNSYWITIELLGEFCAVLNLLQQIHHANLPIICQQLSCQVKLNNILLISLQFLLPKTIQSGSALVAQNKTAIPKPLTIHDPFTPPKPTQQPPTKPALTTYRCNELSYLGYISNNTTSTALLWSISGNIYAAHVGDVIGQGAWQIINITKRALLLKNIQTNSVAQFLRS